MSISKTKMAKSFTAWEKEYRTNPEKFMARRKALKLSTDDYGELCVETFLDYIKSTR
jgi:hypothetical protein